MHGLASLAADYGTMRPYGRFAMLQLPGKRWKHVASIAICVFFLLDGSHASARGDSQEDKASIKDAITQYSYAWDSKDSSAWAALYTESATLDAYQPGEDTPSRSIVSRRKILKYAESNHTGRLRNIQTRHHATAIVFEELTSITARTRHMVLITHKSPSDQHPEIRGTGTYQIEWRKIDEKWLISHRTYYPD